MQRYNFFLFFEVLFLFFFATTVGWWVGKTEKWRSQFLGEMLAVGVSAANTTKANFLKTICPTAPSY